MYIMGSDLAVNELSRRSCILAEIEKWNQLEQTEFIIDNLKLLSFSFLKFVTSICTDLVEKTNVNNQHSNILEEQANDISYFQILKDKSIETKLKILASYLPLLKPNNTMKDKLRIVYTEVINDLFEYCIKNLLNLNECREISTLAYLHPIFDLTQKQFYKRWTDRFEKTILQINTSLKNDFSLRGEEKPKNTLLNERFSFDDGQYLTINHEQYSMNMSISEIRSSESMNYIIDKSPDSTQQSFPADDFNFLHPGKLNSVQSINESDSSINSNVFPSLGNSLMVRQHLPLKSSTSLPPFSDKQSLPTENKLLSLGQKTNNMHKSSTSLMSTDIVSSTENFNKLGSQNLYFGSNSNLDGFITSTKSYGIKGVYQWLKNLRLHKYTELFSSLTYDELIELTDEKLIGYNISLGPRRRILQNLDKLKKRNEKIEELSQSFDEKAQINDFEGLKRILEELTEISMSPMKPHTSPPTSVALLNHLTSNLPDMKKTDNNSDNQNLCSNIIELLEKIQVYLLREKNSISYLSDSSIDTNEKSQNLNYLITSYLKIIDKLFLTKAFNDIQQTLMAKMRSSLHEKKQLTQQTSRSKSPVNNHSKTLNSQNARQRIQNKNLKNAVTRTVSAPFQNQLTADNKSSFFFGSNLTNLNK